MPKSLPTTLPQFLHRYFWEVDASKINPAKSHEYVISRILDRGSLRGIKWVFENFPRKYMIEVVRKSRDWFKKSINFWANYFHLKSDDVKCLNKQYLKTHADFWPY